MRYLIFFGALMCLGCDKTPVTHQKKTAPLVKQDIITAKPLRVVTQIYTPKALSLKNKRNLKPTKQRSLCLVKTWDTRILVAHTARPCADAAFHEGLFELLDIKTRQPIATFDAFISDNPEANVILTRQQGKDQLIELTSGRPIAVQTPRQKSGQKTTIKILLDRTAPGFWLFEATSPETSDYWYVPLSDAKKITQKGQPALFWPDASPKLYHTIDKALYVERSGAPDGRMCALVKYTPGGSECLQKLTPVHQFRHMWRPDVSIIFDKKTKKLTANTRSKINLAPLPTCKIDRLKFGERENLHALVRCMNGDLFFWRPEKLWPIAPPKSGGQWQLLPDMQRDSRWRRLIDLKTKQHAHLDIQTGHLWLLPDRIRARSAKVAIKSPTKSGSPHEVLLIDTTHTPPTLARVGAFSCKGRIDVVFENQQFSTLGCVFGGEEKTCDGPTTDLSIVLDHKNKQVATQRDALLIAKHPLHIFARGARVQRTQAICPAQSFDFFDDGQ